MSGLDRLASRLRAVGHVHDWDWAGDDMVFTPVYSHVVKWRCRGCGAERHDNRSDSVDPTVRRFVDEANRVNGTDL